MDAAVLQVSKPMSGEINSLFHFDSVETFFKTIIIFFDLFSIQWIIKPADLEIGRGNRL